MEFYDIPTSVLDLMEEEVFRILEAQRRKEAEIKRKEEMFEERIEMEMEKLKTFWNNEFEELDRKEEDSLQFPHEEIKESQRVEISKLQPSEHHMKMTKPSQSSIVSDIFQTEMTKITCPKGTKCIYHRFHTGDKIITINCQHSVEFRLRGQIQKAIMNGSFKSLDLPCPENASKRKHKKFKRSTHKSYPVSKNASVWEFIESALKNKNVS